MRLPLFVVLLGLAAPLGTGCASLYHLDQWSTSDETPSPAPSSSNGSSVTTPSVSAGETPSTPSDVKPGPACLHNSDCNGGGTLGASSDASTPPAAVCVAATGHCANLLSASCPRVKGDYTKDGAVVVGTLLGPKGDVADGSLEQAALLAAEEIDAAGGIGGTKPLVVVGCDSGDVLGAAKHLVEDLHVPAIVGPTSGEDVVDVTQQVSAKGGTLALSPTSLVSAISALVDGDLTFRDLPDDAQRAKLVIDQMSSLQDLLKATRSLTTIKLGVVHRKDALGTSAVDSISGKLVLNGHFIGDPENAPYVSIDGYDLGDSTALGNVATTYATTFRPDIVFVTAPELVQGFMVPFEQGLTTGRVINRPYYVLTDAAKTQALLDAITSAALPAGIGRRVRGVGVRADTDSAPVLAQFQTAFKARWGTAPGTASSAYDAMYAIAYAIAGSSDPIVTGATVTHGLRALGVGAPTTVGASGVAAAMQSLGTGKTVSLRGTLSQMLWDPSGDLAAGTVEVWCVGASGFGSSGLTMDVASQVVAGAFVQCQ